MFQKNFWENFQFDFYPIRWPDFWSKCNIFEKWKNFHKKSTITKGKFISWQKFDKNFDKKMLTKPEFQSRIRDKENHYFQATCFEQDQENVTKLRPVHLFEPP